MNDVDFLCWMHESLINVHGEDLLFDYRLRVQAILWHMNSRKDIDTAVDNLIGETK
jgi:hypothetical protein